MLRHQRDIAIFTGCDRLTRLFGVAGCKDSALINSHPHYIRANAVIDGVIEIFRRTNPDIRISSLAERADYFSEVFRKYGLQVLPEFFVSELSLNPIGCLIFSVVKELPNGVRVGPLPNFMHPVNCLVSFTALTIGHNQVLDASNWASQQPKLTQNNPKCKKAWDEDRNLLVRALKVSLKSFDNDEKTGIANELDDSTITLILQAWAVLIKFIVEVNEDHEKKVCLPAYVSRISLSTAYRPMTGGIPWYDDLLIDPSTHPVYSDPVFKPVLGRFVSWFIDANGLPVTFSGEKRDPQKYITLDKLNSDVSNEQASLRRRVGQVLINTH